MLLQSRSENNRITVLFFNLFTWLGGGEYSAYNLVKHLNHSRFHPVMMFCKQGPFVQKVEACGIEAVILPYEIVEKKRLIMPGSIWRNITASLAIKRWVHVQGVDVVQCSDVFALLLLLPSLVLTRIPVVYSVIVFYGRWRSWFFNFLALLFVDRIVVNSQAVKDDLAKKTIGLSSKMTVVYNGVDPTLFFPRRDDERQSIRRRLGLPVDRSIVGFVGRFEVWKGHLTFLGAAERLLASRSDVLFLMVGGAITQEVAPQVRKYREEVVQWIESRNFDGRLLAWGERDDIPEIVPVLDVLVCPSDYEPFGLVALEGYACGIPVVASRTVGAMEVLKREAGVFAAEPRDPDSFASSIAKALDYSRTMHGNASNAQPVGALSHELRHSWQQYARAFEQLYESVVCH